MAGGDDEDGDDSRYFTAASSRVPVACCARLGTLLVVCALNASITDRRFP